MMFPSGLPLDVLFVRTILLMEKNMSDAANENTCLVAAGVFVCIYKGGDACFIRLFRLLFGQTRGQILWLHPEPSDPEPISFPNHR